MTNTVEQEERHERRLKVFQVLVDWSPVVSLVVKAVMWLAQYVG